MFPVKKEPLIYVFCKPFLDKGGADRILDLIYHKYQEVIMYSYEKSKQLIYLNSTMKVFLLLNENWDILIAKRRYVRG